MVDSYEEMIHISNTVINYITFGTDDASLAAFRFMLHQVRAEGQPLGSIDFNKLIPMPQELNMKHLGRMVFKDGAAIEVDIPQDPGALAQAMSAGVWRFQAVAEQSPHHGRNSSKKAHRKEQGR